MIRYVGSKRRIAKQIMPIILDGRKKDQPYVEPFVGGCNSFTFADNPRIGNDMNHYLIAMYKELQNGWAPPESLTNDEYDYINKNRYSTEMHIVGFAGIAGSYGGRFFEGYARGGGRNHVLECQRRLLKNVDKIKGAIFTSVDYEELAIVDGSIVYCDPPYPTSKTYYGKSFDTDRFWQWVRRMAIENTVFISCYEAPDDFECVWQKEIVSSLTKDTGSKKAVEKLWRLKE